MDRGQRIIQAYKNTPWRQQLQVIGLFSALVIFIAIVAGVYLNVTARAATFGREIQSIRYESREVEREIEDMEAQLAYLTSVRYMKRRAEELGFIPVGPITTTYLSVPDYSRETSIDLSYVDETDEDTNIQLPLEYTMSLFDWIREMLYTIGLQTGAVEGP